MVIDDLEIQIQVVADAASKKLEHLTKTMSGLRSTVQRTQSVVGSFKLPPALERVQRQIENQRKSISILNSQYTSTAAAMGADSGRALGIEKRLLSAQDAMDKLGDKAYKMEFGEIDALADTIDKAIGKYERLGDARQRASTLGKATAGIDYDLSQQLETIQRLNNEFTELTGRGHESVAKLGDMAARIRETGEAARAAAEPVKKLSSGFKDIIKRIIVYRLIRGFLTEIGNGIETGLQEIYKFSQAAKTGLSGSMDSLKTDMTYLRNSFVSVLAPLIQLLAPVFNYLVSALTHIIDLFAQLFAMLSGKSTYERATRGAVNYADAAGAAAGEAQELKRQLMGFDELNVLQDTAAQSGGGTGSGAGQNMFELADVSWGLREKLGPVLTWLNSTIGHIWGILQGLGDFVVGAFTGDFDRAFSGVGAIIENFGGLVGDVLGGVSGIFDFTFGGIKKLITGFFDWLQETTGFKTIGLTEFIDESLSTIQVTVEAVLWKLKVLVQDSANMIGSIFRGDWAAAWNYASQFAIDASIDMGPAIQTAVAAMTSTANASADAGEVISTNIAGVLDSLRALAQSRVTAQTDGRGGISFFGVVGSMFTSFLRMKNIGLFAEGGFPDAGQLFLANEAGPELVGSMNGRTAVANNDQIVEGIRQGVYEAVVAAMSGSGGEQRIELFVDGKKMADTVTRYQRQSAKAYG